MKELYKSIIAEFHARALPEFIPRELKIPVNSGKIITVIGSRRAGKTFLFYQIMSEVMRLSPKQKIIYINFEDERLSASADDLQYILDAYYELYPGESSGLCFFFDEIQSITGWEKFVRRVYDTVSRNIFLTGSSSSFLHKEVASSLRGRAVVYELFPLTFKEFLTFRGAEAGIYTSKDKARMNSLFLQYLKQGGFPEPVTADEEFRRKILQSYFDVMIYRDIIERYTIRNITALKYFIKKALSNTANKVSVNKLYNELKSMGLKISKDSLYEFFSFAQDSYLLFMVNRYAESVAAQTVNDKKLYCIDNGLVDSVSFRFSENTGRMLENTVYLFLRNSGRDIYYYSGKGECDFVILDRQNVSELIQVTAFLDKDNFEREVNGLREAMTYFNLKNGFIITLDKEDIITENENTIQVLPAWKWMLTQT